jgi:hypothetical protein
MPGIPIGLVRLDVAHTPIIVLELALNEEVGFHWRQQIEVGAGGLRIERDLKILVIELVDRHGCMSLRASREFLRLFLPRP